MKYSSHGHLTVDTWRQLVNTYEIDMQTPFTKAIQETVKQVSNRPESKMIPTIAGFAAVGAVYAAAGILVVGDGPLPMGDAVAAGLLLIPDAAIFAFGYSLFD